MIEGLPNGPKIESNDTVESTALAGAAAIQRIITDRDNLRNWAGAQHRELTALRAENDDLRHRVLLIRQRYLEFATEILGQFERFDGALREAFEEQLKTSEQAHDPTLVDLVQRLSPSRNSGLGSQGKPGTSE